MGIRVARSIPALIPSFGTRIPPYYLMLALVLLFLLVHGLLRRSHIGWAFRALRDDEVAAELAGVDVARYRVYGALIGAAMLGLAGSTYAFTEGRISPTTFGFGEVDVVVLVMLAFGGIGTLFGPIVGAVTFTIVDEVLIDFGQLRQVAYGILIIVLFLWMPRGLIPTVALHLAPCPQACGSEGIIEDVLLKHRRAIKQSLSFRKFAR